VPAARFAARAVSARFSPATAAAIAACDAQDGVVDGVIDEPQITAQNATGGVLTRTRPLCPYPQTAIHKGIGSTDDAARFTCGGPLATREEVCDSALVAYKDEFSGPIDHREVGKNRGACIGNGPWPGE
jgi:hypothetical protein